MWYKVTFGLTCFLKEKSYPSAFAELITVDELNFFEFGNLSKFEGAAKLSHFLVSLGI